MVQQWHGFHFTQVFIPTMAISMAVYLDLVMDGSAKVSSGSMELWSSFPIVAFLLQSLTVFLELH